LDLVFRTLRTAVAVLQSQIWTRGVAITFHTKASI